MRYKKNSISLSHFAITLANGLLIDALYEVNKLYNKIINSEPSAK